AADFRGGGGQGRVQFLEARVVGDGAELGAGADARLLVVNLNRAQGADARDADDAGRLGDVFLLHVMQVGPAGQQLGVAPPVLEQGNRLLRRGGAKISEILHVWVSSREKIPVWEAKEVSL